MTDGKKAEQCGRPSTCTTVWSQQIRANHEARAFKEGNSSYDDKEIHVTQTQR